MPNSYDSDASVWAKRQRWHILFDKSTLKCAASIKEMSRSVEKRWDKTRRFDGVGYGKRNNTNENSIERRIGSRAHAHTHVTSRHTKSNSFCEIAIYSKSFSFIIFSISTSSISILFFLFFSRTSIEMRNKKTDWRWVCKLHCILHSWNDSRALIHCFVCA